MKLTLILPKTYDRKEDDGDTSLLPPLNLPTIAAITPSHVSVKIIDDRLEEIDYDEEVDFVGITCITETAGRAYDISKSFRERGVPVILGGLHTTLMPDDAIMHADSVLCGEAYGIWQRVVQDVEQGRLQKVYRNLQPPVLSNIPPPRFDLLAKRSCYAKGVRMVNATRGCYMRCTFCSTQEFWEGTFHCRPVKEVVEEIKGGSESYIAFVDDDIGGDKEYARELFEALIPLKIYWFSQTRINLCLDEELLGLAARSGCLGLFTGFESVSMETLGAIRKYQNVVRSYHRAIENCHKHNICIEAGFVFGFDTDNQAVFQDTLRFILDSSLDSININLLHPIPGTPAYRQFDREGRLLTHDWNAWASLEHCLFRPKLLSTQEVEAGAAWVLREVYSWRRILKRIFRALQRRHWFAPYLIFRQNLSYKRRRADPWGGGFNPAEAPVRCEQNTLCQKGV